MHSFYHSRQMNGYLDLCFSFDDDDTSYIMLFHVEIYEGVVQALFSVGVA